MYTYNHQYAAHMGNQFVTVPDQIAENQKQHDINETVFPALLGGDSIMVRLDGEAYGLHTTGTGDMVVVKA